MPSIRQLPRNFPAVVCNFRKSDADEDCQAVLVDFQYLTTTFYVQDASNLLLKVLLPKLFYGEGRCWHSRFHSVLCFLLLFHSVLCFLLLFFV